MRAVIVGLAAALALLAGGCGGGRFASPVGDGENADTTTATTAASATVDAGPRHDLVSAAEVAAAVNLRPADFPYLPEHKRSEESGGGSSAHDFDKCIERELPAEANLATAESPELSGLLGDEAMFFSSSVEVFPSPRGADEVARALRSRQAFGCFAKEVRPGIEDEQAGSGVEVLSVKVARIESPAPGIAGSFGFRITASVAPTPDSSQLTAYALGTTPDGRPRATIYVDFVVFVSGRIAVLMLAGGGPEPVPASIERNTLQLLRLRAEKEAERLP